MAPATTDTISKWFAVMKLLILSVINLMLQLLMLILKTMTCLLVVVTGIFLFLALLSGCGNLKKR